MSLLEAINLYGEKVVKRSIEKGITFEEAADQITIEDHELHFGGVR